MSVKEQLFSAEEIARGRRYHRPRYVALVVDLVLALAVQVAYVAARPELGLAWWLEAPAIVALVLATTAVVQLPVSWWRGYVHEHRWGLSTQTPRGWAVDWLKGLAIGIVLAAVALTALVGLARWTSWWPLVAAVAAASSRYSAKMVIPG